MNRHIYRELAKITQCKRTRMMYFRNMARLWRKEKATAGTVTR